MASIFASSHSLLLCSWLFVLLFLSGESFSSVAAADKGFSRKTLAYNAPPPSGRSSTPFWKRSSRTRKLALRRMQSPMEPTEDEEEVEVAEPPVEAEAEGTSAETDEPKRGHVVVSTEMELPFPAHVAFDAFSDLPRQPSWSPWIHSVSYIDPPTVEKRETKWKMKYMGVTLSWNAIQTELTRPNVIAWKSTNGLKNFGRVDFYPTEGPEDFTIMKMTLTFVIPGPVARMFRKSDKVQGMVKNRMIVPTLVKFSEIVMENDMKQKEVTPEALPMEAEGQ